MADQFFSKFNIRRRLVDMGTLLGATYWAEQTATALVLPSGAISASNPLPTMSGLDIVGYDYVVASSYVTGGPQSIIFKTGGSGGATVATLALTYDGLGNFLTLTRT